MLTHIQNIISEKPTPAKQKHFHTASKLKRHRWTV